MTQNQTSTQTDLNHPLLLARGGGGGSSSGGGHSSGGGGGYTSSHSGTSSSYDSTTAAPPLWFFGIGFALVIAWLFYRYVLRKKPSPLATSLGVVVSVAYVLVLAYGAFVGAVIAVPLTIVMVLLLNRRFKREADAKRKRFPAAPDDIQAKYVGPAKELMNRFQKDWSNLDTSSIRSYTTATYGTHLELILQSLRAMGRRNDVRNFTIEEAVVLANSTPDTGKLAIHFLAKSDDYLLDKDGKTLYTDTSSFGEAYHFEVTNSTLLLSGIDEDSADATRKNSGVVAFAAAEKLYYSLDWGRLLLPTHGQLFAGANFTKSDINNHVIGRYHNEIIQLYTYDPTGTSLSDTYVVAQMTVPRDYGGIIVHAKNTKLPAPLPHGYGSYPLEWNDFNKRYELFATDQEKITGFELLEPVYMEKLFATALPINIEVIDNVVYLYSPDPSADYATMLSLLHDAFEALKM